MVCRMEVVYEQVCDLELSARQLELLAMAIICAASKVIRPSKRICWITSFPSSKNKYARTMAVLGIATQELVVELSFGFVASYKRDALRRGLIQ